jgi:hypothetical protein
MHGNAKKCWMIAYFFNQWLIFFVDLFFWGVGGGLKKIDIFWFSMGMGHMLQ